MPKTKEQKRDEAYLRAQEHDKRTPTEQMFLTSQRPGNSERERARLSAKIEGGTR